MALSPALLRKQKWLSMLVFPAALVGCGGGGGGGTAPPVVKVQGQATLGPLSEAVINAYRVDDLATLIAGPVTAGSSETDLTAAGTFTLSLEGVDDDTLILFTATGGEDIDADDDGVADTEPTPNGGVVHSIATAAEWRAGSANISALTEVAWHFSQDVLGDDNALRYRLDEIAVNMLGQDLNGDGTIDRKDITAFIPRNDKQHTLRDYQTLLPDSDDSNATLVEMIHSGAAESDKTGWVNQELLGDIVWNAMPSAEAGASQSIDEQTSVTLSGSGTDSDGSIASYAWHQTAGASVSLSGADQAQASFTSPTLTNAEELIFRLMVTDDAGATSTDTVTVTVNPVNLDPVALAGADQSVDEQALVSLTGSGSDEDGSIASYAWSQTAGASVSLSRADQAEASFSAPSLDDAETLSFRLTVIDNEGGSSTDDVSVAVSPILDTQPAQTTRFSIKLVGIVTVTDQPVASLFNWNLSPISRAYALEGDDGVAANNFAVTVVNPDGTVAMVVPLTETTAAGVEAVLATLPANEGVIYKDEVNGTWEVNVPGIPRADCLVIVDPTQPISVFQDQSLPPSTLFAPTTIPASEGVLDIDIGSTVAYQGFLADVFETLESNANASFADAGIDVDDPASVAIIDAFVDDVQQLVEEMELPAAEPGQTIEDYLTAVVEPAVSAAVVLQVDATAVELVAETDPSVANITDALQAGKTLSVLESWNGNGQLEIMSWSMRLEDDGLGGFYLREDEMAFDWPTYSYVLEPIADDGFILTASGWQAFDYNNHKGVFNPDGSIEVSYGEAALSGLVEGSLQGFEQSITGSSIRDVVLATGEMNDYFDGGYDYRNNAVFSAGATAFKASFTVIGGNYLLDDWDDCQLSEQIGGMCNGVYPTNNPRVLLLTELISPAAATDFFSVKGVHAGWKEGNSIIVELVAGGGANWYDLDWNLSTLTPLTTATWIDETVHGERVFRVSYPQTVVDYANAWGFDLYQDIEGEEMLLVEYLGAVREGQLEPAGATEQFWMFNDIAMQDQLDAAQLAGPLGGSWVLNQGGSITTLAFGNGGYKLVEYNATDSALSGVEIVSGSYNETSHIYSVGAGVLVNSNNDGGLYNNSSADYPMTVSPDGRSLTIVVAGEPDVTFNNVAREMTEALPLLGSWNITIDSVEKSSITFLDASRYISSSVDLTTTLKDSVMDYGTYTYDLTTEVLVLTPTSSKTVTAGVVNLITNGPITETFTVTGHVGYFGSDSSVIYKRL